MELLASRIQSQAVAMDSIAVKTHFPCTTMLILDSIQVKQEDLFHSLGTLAGSITQMSLLTAKHIEDINSTALSIKHGLQSSIHVSHFDWGVQNLLRFLSLLNICTHVRQVAIVWSHSIIVEYPSFENMVSKPYIRAIVFLFGIIWSVVSSVLTSVSVSSLFVPF